LAIDLVFETITKVNIWSETRGTALQTEDDAPEILQTRFTKILLPILVVLLQQHGVILLEIGIEDDIWESEDVRNLLTNIIDLVVVILFNRVLREEPKSLVRGLIDSFHKGIGQPALIIPEPVLVEENPEHAIFDVCGNRICLQTKERRPSIIHALWEKTGKTHTISGFVDGESELCIGNRVLEVIFAKVTITVDVTFQGRDKAVNVSTRVRCLSACEPCKGRKSFRGAYALTQKESNPLGTLPRFVRMPKLH
jgi:hypothetical protein